MIRSAPSMAPSHHRLAPREVAPAPTTSPSSTRGFAAAGFGRDTFESGVRQVDFRVLSPLGHATAPTPAIANQWARNAGNAVIISPSGARTIIGQGYSPGR
ncbi:MAG: hypothetical protein SFW67_36500 [Myxococcaceae bacterium]|nr:hypothetical protein [Myxococcaceae bacterium]